MHDVTVRAWEHQIFGGDISRTWWQAAPSVFWSTRASWSLLRLLPDHRPAGAHVPVAAAAGGGPAVGALAAGHVPAHLRRVRTVSRSPGPTTNSLGRPAWFIDNFTARLVYGTLANGSAYGAAFPSSHVAATLVATAAAFRGSRRVGWILVVPALLLTVGVVYCQMHYAVDALAGVAVAGAVVACRDLVGETATGVRRLESTGRRTPVHLGA